MGVVQNIFGLVRDINDRKKQSRVDDELKNYLGNPEETIAAIQNIDPRFGIALDRQRVQDQSAQQKATQEQQDRYLGLVRDYMRGLPEGSDINEAMDQMAPFMQQLGVPEQMYGGFRSAVNANPNALLDDEAYGHMMQDRFSGTVVTPGSIYMRGGKEVTRAPYAPKAVTTGAGATTTIFDPNTREFVTPGGASAGPGGGSAGVAPPVAAGALSVQNLLPIFSAQESNDDYTAVNRETGAMGKYQVMPDTGRALAKRIGAAWNPRLMTQDTPAARRYQDAIGAAAVEESIAYGKGDPMEVFGHYYGGPDKRKWGPRTRQYQQDMMARLGGGGAGGASAQGPTITPTSVSVPPRPSKADVTTEPMSPEEVAARGYPPGTIVQRDSTGKETVKFKPPANIATKTEDRRRAAQTTYQELGDSLTALDNLINHPGLDVATGMVQGRLPGWAVGREGQNFRNELDTFKNSAVLTKLMEMKAAGSSGLGPNPSNQDAARLEAAIGVLQTTNDEATLRKSLRTIKSVLQRRRLQAKQDMHGGRSSSGGPAPLDTVINTPSGKMIKTANGWEPLNGQ